MKALVAIILISAFALPALAHTRWKPGTGIVPRSTRDDIKDPPPQEPPAGCGTGIARVSNPAVLRPGQQLTVNWEETIQHTGYFKIYFSASGDANFQELKKIDDNQSGTADLPHQFSTTITLPSTPCTDCTLLLLQRMDDNHAANPTYYKSCADIQLVVAPDPTPVPSATPVPTPGPTPICP